MGHPPEKPTKKGNVCNLNTFLIAAIVAFLSITLTALVTYQVTKTAWAPVEPPEYNPPEVVDDGILASDLRLPTTAIPLDYDLQIKTYLPGYGYKADSKTNLTFEGQVTIRLNITKQLRKITLNSLDLKYNGTKSVFTVGKKEIRISSIEQVEKFEKVYVNLAEAVDPTEDAKLKLVYTGDLRTDMSGLYQTTYTDENGNAKMAAVTQFEPVYARRMVPCYDEPAFKASWTVTVIHPKGTIAIANGIEDGDISEVNEEFSSSKFKPTPKMSSYLLAIFISEFEYNEATTKSGVRFRVWSRPEEKNSTEYAVVAGVKCLEFYENYYGIKFPMEKQDMVALPDFSAGAMENWGLITYRENALLYDKRIYPGAQKRRVAVVIAHELAHQWFGNLVTLKWWNDLWLNEGFATLVEYLGTDEISDNNFRMREWFEMDALWTALDYDSIASTHPMTFKIDKAMEVLDSFDSITYDKGGSVLAMLRKAIGEEHFNKGINHYLTRHQYSNADASDLFAALSDKIPDTLIGANGKKFNISQFADPWTKQLGYPLLTVKSLNTTHVTISQERFKQLKDAKEQDKYSNPVWGFKWDVPIWYQEYGSEDIKMIWMKSDEDLVFEAKQPVIINAESEGFYRTTYSDELWLKIIDEMKQNHKQFSSKTRVRLIDDSFAAAAAGHLNYSIPIQLIEYLKNEKDYTPWSATIAKIKSVAEMYGSDPEKEHIQKAMIALSKKSPAQNSAEFVSNNYADDTKFFEVLAAQGLLLNDCTMGDAKCMKSMAKLFDDKVMNKCGSKDMLSECSQIAAPFRSEAYCQAVKQGDDEVFQKIFNWYMIERNQVEKSNLMTSLACSRNIITLKKLLLDAMQPTGSSFRLQDVSTLFYRISYNDVAQDSMLNFMMNRWDDLLARIGTDRSGFQRVLSAITGTIKTKQGLDQLRMFRTKTESAHSYDFRKMEENIGTSIKWRSEYSKLVTKMFTEMTKNI